ncbi:hypothetical protein DFH28DRAFT_922962 [Melampsora americana]|nr:hypothetical protein DFH28DRAFT_922962 [Melampsora americana]
MTSIINSRPSIIQPTHPPHPWQLCGPALCHLVLYSTDLTSIRVRFPVLSRTRTAIGSGSRTSIRFDHPDCAPLHLRLAIGPNYVGSIQVHGPQGIKLQDRHIFPPNPLPSSQEHPWIELRDGDIFHVAQWPFKFEQRWDLYEIDWNLFNLDSVTDAETRKLIIGCRDLCKQNTLNSNQPSNIDSSLDQNSDPVHINTSTSNSIQSLNLDSEKNQDHIGILNSTDTTSSLAHSSDELRLDCPRSESSSLSSDSDSEDCPINPQSCLPTRSSSRLEQTPPRSSHAILKVPKTDLIPSKQLRLVITPQKSNARLSWPFLASQPQSQNLQNRTNPESQAVKATSPIMEQEQITPISPSTSDPDMTHVSFRRRSYRRSPEAVNQKRVRVNGPLLDDDTSGEDDHGDDEDDIITQQPYRSPPSPGRRTSHFLPSPEASTSTSPQSPPAIGTTPFDLSQPPSPITPPDLRPRRKSLLQKILIKRAVEVHLAQTPEHPEPIGGCSGFSSSDEEDDEQAEEEDTGSTDEDVVDAERNSTTEAKPAPVSTENEESPENPSSHTFLPQTSTLASSSATDDLATQASRVFPSTNGKVHSVHPHGVSMFPTSLLSPTRFSPTHARRSISPSAKLLAEYESKAASGQSISPSPTSVEFPLKSSFRRQSYTPEELQSFSTQAGPANLQFTPSATQIRTALKYNTQLNSLSPSYTDEDEEQQRAERRRSLRSSTPGPSRPSFTPSPPKPNKIKPTAVQSEQKSPHRLIRTPRSFLIKRGGSLTPLGVPFSRSPIRQQPIEPIEEDGEYELDESGKRKVRFDKDVFCLEFDKLPEELPKEPRSKKSKTELSPEVSNQDTAPKPRGNRRRKASDPGNTNSSRPRRASSRLSAPVSSRDHASRRLRSDQSSNPITPFQDRQYSAVNSNEGLTSSVDDLSMSPMIDQPDQNDTIISQIKQRFLSLGIGGNNGTRQRANSLPADVTRLTNRINEVEKTTEPMDLVNEMKWLSLNTITTHPYLKQHSSITERPHSAPSTAHPIATTPRLKFPELGSFAPQLVGVKELIFAPMQRLSLPHLDMSWKNIFTSWRDPVNPTEASLMEPQGDQDGGEDQSDDASSQDSVIVVINKDALPMSHDVEPSDLLSTAADVPVVEDECKIDYQEDTVSSNTSSKVENISADEDQRQTNKKPSRRKVTSPPISSNSNTRTLRSRSTNTRNGVTSTIPESINLSHKRSNLNSEFTKPELDHKTKNDKNPKVVEIKKESFLVSPRKTRSRTRTKTETEEEEKKSIRNSQTHHHNLEIGNVNGLINHHSNHRRRPQNLK